MERQKGLKQRKNKQQNEKENEDEVYSSASEDEVDDNDFETNEDIVEDDIDDLQVAYGPDDLQEVAKKVVQSLKEKDPETWPKDKQSFIEDIVSLCKVHRELKVEQVVAILLSFQIFSIKKLADKVDTKQQKKKSQDSDEDSAEGSGEDDEEIQEKMMKFEDVLPLEIDFNVDKIPKIEENVQKMPISESSILIERAISWLRTENAKKLPKTVKEFSEVITSKQWEQFDHNIHPGEIILELYHEGIVNDDNPSSLKYNKNKILYNKSSGGWWKFLLGLIFFMLFFAPQLLDAIEAFFPQQPTSLPRKHNK